jgi:hypothetical protein
VLTGDQQHSLQMLLLLLLLQPPTFSYLQAQLGPQPQALPTPLSPKLPTLFSFPLCSLLSLLTPDPTAETFVKVQLCLVLVL